MFMFPLVFIIFSLKTLHWIARFGTNLDRWWTLPRMILVACMCSGLLDFE